LLFEAGFYDPTNKSGYNAIFKGSFVLTSTEVAPMLKIGSGAVNDGLLKR
jgi:hypothetical protein